MIDVNPAKVGVDTPVRRRKEQHPFESWAELEALAAAIGPRYGPMILFAAATGPRPAEWIALEKRDVDRKERVVYVRRSFTRGELKIPKTEASMRAVPLQGRALDALDRIEGGNGSPLLFPGERGGYLDIHHFRPYQWRPAQKVVGIDPAAAGLRICRPLRYADLVGRVTSVSRVHNSTDMQCSFPGRQHRKEHPDYAQPRRGISRRKPSTRDCFAPQRQPNSA